MASTSEEIQEDDATQVALSNQVILKHIYGELPFKDLKNCRLVNKSWSFEAGSYIRDFRQCGASISCEKPCCDLYELDQVFSNMNVLPINSLKIGVGFWNHTVCQREASVYNYLLEKLSLKDAEIYWLSSVEYVSHCPAISFVVTLLREKLTTSQGIKLQGFPAEIGQRCAQDWTPWLPKLTVLEVVEMFHSFENCVLKIIDGAPNLQKLRGTIRPVDLGQLPEDKHVLWDHFLVSIESDEDEERCWKLAETGPALTELCSHVPEERRYWRCFFYLLHNIGKPENFIYFHTGYRYAGEVPECTSLYIDYSKVLPVLKEVDIFHDVYQYFDEEELEQPIGHDVAPAAPKYAETVTKLSLRVYTEELAFLELSLIYPKVHEIVVGQHFNSFWVEIPYEDLWAANWPLLESIYLTEKEPALDRNHDAAFLGINPEELELLKELGEESLEKMNIVPVRPCVLTMPRLKSLKIRFSNSGDRNGSLEPDQAFLSKLTGILAFKKLTKTGVQTELVCSTTEIISHLNHLDPFTSVTLDK